MNSKIKFSLALRSDGTVSVQATITADVANEAEADRACELVREVRKRIDYPDWDRDGRLN